MSEGAVIGSNVTFNCTATGCPKPTITWKKDNDSHSIQAKVITDDETTLSQLVITGVTREDYGKYQCVANNSTGVKTSRAALLHQIGQAIISCFVFGSLHMGRFGGGGGSSSIKDFHG